MPANGRLDLIRRLNGLTGPNRRQNFKRVQSETKQLLLLLLL